MSENGRPLTAAALRSTPPRLRIDRLRGALRGGTLDLARVESEKSQWLALFREIRDGAFRVLILEVLHDQRGEEVDELLWEAAEDRSDGVRLESLRLLCHRFPEEVPRLAERYAEDENLELRFLLAERLHRVDRPRAEELLLKIMESEASGPKERQALDRVICFFVEEVQAVHLLPTLRGMREEFDDPEDFFGWAIDKLSRAPHSEG